MDPSLEESAVTDKYTVIARRYRPKTFSELVGQPTVSQALLNAIHTNRVGHAYLFTGARGVGKTSTARIFAKALNASANSDGEFDPNSDLALAIDSGEDMDVIEIDGASNRGIDEIRQLRANASIRPSRSPYKIYIIDEVHMLTTQAFNALLKTLEEPPGHVKFIFCTTDPEKMPITVLSRCQRFDFPPVQTDQILARLQFICKNEGTQADEAALQIIARRAAGSMRDSQSLLEQLLSFGGDHIRVEDVHAMLGTADETRLASFSSKLIERDAANALKELDDAANEGVDVGQLAEQLLGYLRDMMVVTVGCSPDLVKTANPNSVAQLKEWGTTWGTAALMGAIQILDEAIVKMRHSVQSRVLIEIALVQICQLQDLQALTDLARAFAAGNAAPPPRLVLQPSSEASAHRSVSSAATTSAPPAKASTPTSQSAEDSKKKEELAEARKEAPTPLATAQPSAPPQPSPPSQVTQANSHSSRPVEPASSPSLGTAPSPTSPTQPSRIEPSTKVESPSPAAGDAVGELVQIMRDAALKLGGLIIECTNMVVRVEDLGKGKWKVFIARDGSFAMDYFTSGDNARRLSGAIAETAQREAQLEFVLTQESAPNAPVRPKQEVIEENRPTVPQSQLIRTAMNNPLVKQFVEMFEGQVIRVDRAQEIRPSIETNAESSKQES